MNNILKEDFEQIIKRKEFDFEIFAGKTVFITGATGLIGFNLINFLLMANKSLNQPIRIVAMVRNPEKANNLFDEKANLEYFVGDITLPIIYEGEIDYIIHSASQTSSRDFIDNPLGVINTAIKGTINTLNFAKEKNIRGMVYLSSMEVYGAPKTDEKISEIHSTNIDTMKIRSCYPESKRMCENLCAIYSLQFGVPVKVIRLTQTFGPGVQYNDTRVFAEFARCAIEKKDITLHTVGATKRNYIYTADAVTAIFTVLTKGISGEAYNVANEKIYCSIKEMAEMVCKKCADGKIKVIINEEENKYGYAPTLRMNLDTTKVKNLGWSAYYPLDEMFYRMCSYMIGEH